MSGPMINSQRDDQGWQLYEEMRRAAAAASTANEAGMSEEEKLTRALQAAATGEEENVIGSGSGAAEALANDSKQKRKPLYLDAGAILRKKRHLALASTTGLSIIEFARLVRAHLPAPSFFNVALLRAARNGGRRSGENSPRGASPQPPVSPAVDSVDRKRMGQGVLASKSPLPGGLGNTSGDDEKEKPLTTDEDRWPDYVIAALYRLTRRLGRGHMTVSSFLRATHALQLFRIHRPRPPVTMPPVLAPYGQVNPTMTEADHKKETEILSMVCKLVRSEYNMQSDSFLHRLSSLHSNTLATHFPLATSRFATLKSALERSLSTTPSLLPMYLWRCLTTQRLAMKIAVQVQPNMFFHLSVAVF
jgi:hypothetical protein